MTNDDSIKYGPHRLDVTDPDYYRKDRAGYKELKFVAQQMLSQMDMFPKTEDEESLVDCICG